MGWGLFALGCNSGDPYAEGNDVRVGAGGAQLRDAGTWDSATCCVDAATRNVDPSSGTSKVGLSELPYADGDYPVVLADGLSAQLLRRVDCLFPGWLQSFEDLRESGGLVVLRRSPRRLSKDALEVLRGVALENEDYITLRTAYRDLALQFYDYLWGQELGWAALPPGESVHQAGLAVDVHFHEHWRTRLVAAGFEHPYPETDPPHFEWPTAETARYRARSVEAFVTLWNDNHGAPPLDLAAVLGGSTALLDALAEAPAAGFHLEPCAGTP